LVELASGAPLAGIVHVAAGGQCSWFELAREIVARAGARCEIKPGSTADLDRPAPRPPFSVLRSERSSAPVLPDWRDGLGAFMESGVPS
jgi:dTDP-4-dehydrorhamnose reductase